MADKAPTNTEDRCAVCSGDAKKQCSRCRGVSYCDTECQKKEHKKQCLAPNSTCTRCLETIDANTLCRIPHPEHLIEDQGSLFGGGSTTLNEFCGACEEVYAKTAPFDGDADSSDTVWTYKPASCRWCYEGPHTTEPIPPHDDRRVRNDIASITVGPNMQDEIDALSPQIRILTIKRAGGFYDGSIKPVLNKSMPNLETLQLIDVAFREVKLNKKLTPKLETLEMQNIPDECDIQVVCPSLEDFDMRYYHGPAEWINDMLQVATKLERFQSYKLGVDDIRFQSNALQEIHLHRSDCLCYVSIWAPRLQYLRLQGCYSLQDIEILDRHATLSQDLPRGFTKTKFHVETTNSCLSPRFIQRLNSQPRVMWHGEEVDETAGVGGGMEAMFMRMQGFAGGF